MCLSSHLNMTNQIKSQPDLASGPPPSGPAAPSTSVPTPPVVPSTSGVPSLPSLPAAQPAHAAPPDVQALMKDWQEELFTTMQAPMQVMMADAPPQPTVGPSIPRNMGLTGCGSWVPLMVERHHGLNISPVQSELTVAPGPGALQVICQRQVEMDGLARDNYETPVPLALALRMTAGAARILVAVELPLALTPAVIAVHLLLSFNGTGPEIVPLSPVGALHPAWQGDLPGTFLYHRDAVLHRTRCSDFPGAVVRPLGPSGFPPIASAVTPPLGHLHLDLAGGESPFLAVHAPGLLTMIINKVCMRRINAFSGSVISLLSFSETRTWTQTSIPLMKSLSSQRRPLRNRSTTYFVLQFSPITLTLIQWWTIQTISWCPIIRMQLRARRCVIWMTWIPTTVCSNTISLSIAFLGTKTVMPGHQHTMSRLISCYLRHRRTNSWSM